MTGSRDPTPSRGGIPARNPSHLAESFDAVAERVTHGGGNLSDADLEAIRAAGSRAAEHGMTAAEAVDLYLQSAGRTRGDPTGGEATCPPTWFDAIRAAVPVLVEGHQSAGQNLVRQEETIRREFIDDLLRGEADLAGIVQRAEPFALDLSASHQVLLAGPRGERPVEARDQGVLDRAVITQYGDRGVLVTTKGGYLVALVPGGSPGADVDDPARRLQGALSRASTRKSWRIAVGRPYSGAYGVARSYQEAREAITLVERLHPDEDMVQTRDLLIYRVLGRDRGALTDLVEAVLTPLDKARGGAEPLVDTLEAYFAAGEVATEAARRLHVSVRTVTYRLAKIAGLTGYDPTIPAQRLTLQAAVVGARLLPWPASEVSSQELH